MDMDKEDSKNDDICVIVPAYNESPVIGQVVRGIIDRGYKNVIVVDDGSVDKTSEAANDAGAIVYRHKINCGKGAAVKTGLAAAKNRHAEIVVTIDGDGQHDPDDISQLIEPIVNGSSDVVLGTRPMTGGGMPVTRVCLNKIGNFFTWLMMGLAVSDSQSGFRAYDAKALGYFNEVGDKYEYDSEIIRQIHRYGLRFKEVPIKVYYTKYSISKTHKQSLENGIRTFFRMIWNILS